VKMNILIDLNHPAHVHLFKHFYFELIAKGHDVHVTAKNVGSIIRLLDQINIPYIIIGNKPDRLYKKILFQMIHDVRIAKIAFRNKIDLGVGVSLSIPQVSRISPMKSIMFEDDDEAIVPLSARFAHPFADWIVSPDALQHERFSNKRINYSGYHELAYLHPKRFIPDQNVLIESGINPDEVFFILRFNAFAAHHDKGAAGLSQNDKQGLIDKLSRKGRVLITTERKVEPEFAKYRLPVSPEKIHSLMHYATMLIGDSQTMTSEAAILGTPALKCNSFAGRLSVPNELENKYKLCFSYQPSEVGKLFDKIDELLAEHDLKKLWQERRSRMLRDKIDVTAFMIWFVENLPKSAEIMKSDPEFQTRFR
jgi:predicted glycosyltransferase